MQEIIENFFSANRNLKPKTITTPSFSSEHEKYEWVLHKSEIPYLQVNLENFPHEEIYREALALKPLFIDHRANDPSQMGAEHKGWSSLTIHGISQHHTMNWDSYPDYKKLGDENLVNYQWTEVADRIPATVKYFKENFPHDRYTRVRFMLLKAGGYILPHRDRDHKLLFPINIALNNPEACEFVMEDQGLVPFKDGRGFLLDLSNRHCVWNRSNEDRIHIIVHWKAAQFHLPAGKKWGEMVNSSYDQQNLSVGL